eukprot:CAMPEP_0175522706 /NCGR_PEP_ID=MMETSP0096-20121207/17685_1 /TAXON_ID=311494 /ORGANISM="Alexandrium monilatum, Strain CCMP3105" /LENGTH=239 /DNA_ID=CAMNT_0016825207 /DNA_START=44 /DNA_END=761 /DNA_ORIENTATION=+
MTGSLPVAQGSRLDALLRLGSLGLQIEDDEERHGHEDGDDVSAMPHAATAKAVDREVSAIPSAPGGTALRAGAERTAALVARVWPPTKAEELQRSRVAAARSATGRRRLQRAIVRVPAALRFTCKKNLAQMALQVEDDEERHGHEDSDDVRGHAPGSHGQGGGQGGLRNPLGARRHHAACRGRAHAGPCSRGLASNEGRRAAEQQGGCREERQGEEAAAGSHCAGACGLRVSAQKSYAG